MCIVSTVSSVRVVGNVSVRGVNKVELRKKKNVSQNKLAYTLVPLLLMLMN